jgi:hypothetical protein
MSPLTEMQDEGNYIDLMALPEGDPMRERLLTDLKAEYKHINGIVWRPVEPGRSLDHNTVNTLDGHWITWFKWRAPQEQA